MRNGTQQRIRSCGASHSHHKHDPLNCDRAARFLHKTTASNAYDARGAAQVMCTDELRQLLLEVRAAGNLINAHRADLQGEVVKVSSLPKIAELRSFDNKASTAAAATISCRPGLQ